MKFLSVLFVLVSVAESSEIPEALEQWQQWVQFEQGYRNCPHYQNQPVGKKSSHVCAWPDTLEISISDRQASFSINWDVIEDSWLFLPGDIDSWPQAVKANNQPITVTSANGKPRIYLTKGKHQIKGKFSWSTRPETIEVPAEIADIKLNLDGKSINFPERKVNSLWLGESASTAKVESNNVELEVNRLIIDGHPMTMYLAMEILVSGVARNEKLGKVGSELLQITNLEGGLSAYVDSDGYLWAQLKPGNWELNISFNILGWPEQIPFQRDGTNWPKQEVWAYQDNKNIRLSQISGVVPINPEQTFSRWDQVPNYLLSDGDVLNIKEQKRGTLNQSEQLNLYRQLWLSFDGESYRSKDQISGEKLGNWRLNAQTGYQLLNATSHQETLLITESDQKEQGLELRTPAIDLQVSGEFKSGTSHSISGWLANFDYIKTDLFLPYGYMAFATNNVDKSNNVWLEKWALWDIFVVMLLVAFTFKVIGLKASVFAFVALVLGYHEVNMPVAVWVNVIFAIALFSFKPSGKFYTLIRSYLYISLLGLVVALTPFLISQVRLSIHPQLENSGSVNPSADMVKMKKSRTLNKIYTQSYNTRNAIQSEMDTLGGQDKITVTGSSIRNADQLNRYQADAILQAGKGTPQWRFNQISLQWDGPITADQSFSLYLLTPTLRVIWRLLLVFSAVFWLLQLVQKTQEKTRKLQQASPTGMVFVLLALFLPASLMAQGFPSSGLLQQLQSRIYQQPNCAPNCASIESVTVSANGNGNQLQIKLVYHAFADSAVAIPGSDGWRINKIELNGNVTQNRISYKKQSWIAVKKGVNTLVLTGVIANSNHISVLFPLPPGKITTESNDWQFAGLDGQTLTNNTLQLIAMARNITSAEQSKTTEIKQFVKINRRLTFDDKWFLTTRVERIAPISGAINLSVPLITNEHPTSKLQLNDKGQVMVSISPDESEVSWFSVIDKLETIELIAADNSNYLEVWEILSAPQWHVDISGIPIVAPENFESAMDDYFIHIYMPRPGEKLKLDISRPNSVAGEILSVESVSNIFTVGKRSTKAISTINYRATQGGDFQIQL
ncbi:MAG: hypothetical protein L3J52_01705, partial [Proteobacteria bacterium]|nr:hypothetical protein [Pseudomonadota bacterium]